MKRSWIIWGIVLLVLVVTVLAGVKQYNRVIVLDESVNGAWAEVQTRYQQRMDLIGNLVNTVKGVANFEQSTLTGVIEARAKATAVNINPQNLSQESLQQFQSAQNGLSSALARLMVVVEQYPTLKATENFTMLQTQIEGQENRIAVARNKFNESVKEFNMSIRKFPMLLFAGIFDFEKKGYFQADAEASKAPTVDFSK
jgi:LemA protein